jgi:hypothetical protein
MRESVIEQALYKRVLLLCGEIRKLSYVGRRGAPDRMVVLPGRLVLVELKATDKTPDPHQAREIERLRNLGVPVVVISSFDDIDFQFPL